MLWVIMTTHTQTYTKMNKMADVNFYWRFLIAVRWLRLSAVLYCTVLSVLYCTVLSVRYQQMERYSQQVMTASVLSVLSVLYQQRYCICIHNKEGDPKGWSTVLITALGSWGKSDPRGQFTTRDHLYSLRAVRTVPAMERYSQQVTFSILSALSAPYQRR